MSERKRVLLLGGTGAMGTCLAPELSARGFSVLVTSRKAHSCDDPNVRYLLGNAKDEAFFAELMREHYDAIVDFMIYNTASFAARRDALLTHTDHYLFLSSYRVYADAGKTPLTEQSPRLLDTVQDEAYLKTDEYALTKARQEDLLRASDRVNYTIIRPAITYSFGRFQLGTMEAEEFLGKAVRGEAIPFPKDLLEKQTTMTYAGDVAKMLAALVLNEDAFGKTYTAATAEHHSWQEVIDCYRTVTDLKIRPVSTQAYLDVVGRPWQIKYDRMFDRIVDNTAILNVTGLRQSDLTPLSEGLPETLRRFLNDPEAAQRVLSADGPKQKRGGLLRRVKERLYRIPAIRNAVQRCRRGKQ